MIWKKDRLKPSQPYFVLNTEDFQQEIYLRQGISHFYTFKTNGKVPIYAVPDGCIDLFFQYDEFGTMCGYACGTVLEYKEISWIRKGEVFGVRFLPGYHPAGLQVSLRELIGMRYELMYYFPSTFSFALLEAEHDFYQRIRVFLQEYTKLEKEESKPFGKKELVYSVKDYVYEADGVIKISKLAEKTGYSERYINRIFIEEMGFSPKTFCKIIQFQRALEFMNYGAPDKMTDAAAHLGYYDQPQFIRDFKKYAGRTPYHYLKLIQSEKYAGKVVSTKYL